MTRLSLVAYAHLVGAVLVVGYALFWAIMAWGSEREPDRREAQRLLGLTAASRWPYVPKRLRPSLTGLGWGFLALMGVTGAALLAARGMSGALELKLGLVAIVVAAQAALAERPSPLRLYLHGAAVLAVVVVSAFLRR